MFKINKKIIFTVFFTTISFFLKRSYSQENTSDFVVVLDAGHGGKDPGTMGRRGTKEKDIALDITKRIGILLEKNTKLKVIYTRREDVFVPLWKRTKIANESNGKMFLSIHVNANPNKTAYGFETYLLRPGKTEDAIEVAYRENEVIKIRSNNN